ncbi:isoaspartyl peptidase/L-asparaginase [Marinihelvus fidelis]|uniref:Isoaspartyl peptidase n=1 Tax=Marinihelvus fidelis TaxID=2613842 RepID=A0A5N0TC94_9GAMM|nr:isoaspartyl peptidase/L-asparaginase [Marinihelvus fidelis]KAA9130949.1 isoaspartyl peptidase/L-asparaginase [Marinihelvus fidelis]
MTTVRQARKLVLSLLLLPALCAHANPGNGVAIAIHGGAGTISRAEMTAEREAAFRAKLTEAVTAGHQVLIEGGDGVDAVRTAINILEDSPLFNAGKGAVFTAAGTNELDASVMDGATRNAGAVAGVKHIRNPIDLAISVMNDSKHVMLSGDGAEAFAREQGFEMIDPSYFYTEHRWKALEKAREGERDAAASLAEPPKQTFFSTVGAVALDANGDLAAGTSTGGMTNKRWGRIGDSPVIGAGTFADNASCAVSATGHGEFFIRWVVAYDICQRVAHGASMTEAAGTVINDVLVEAGGTGGVISLDANGDIAMPFNTEGMYRASIDTDGKLYVGIYGDE